jgi:hypothetical protein
VKPSCVIWSYGPYSTITTVLTFEFYIEGLSISSQAASFSQTIKLFKSSCLCRVVSRVRQALV